MSNNHRSAVSSTTAPGRAERGPLASPEQRLVEERAIGIYSRPEIFAAKQETLALFRADRNAKLIDQEALIAQSVDEHYFHASLVAVNETPRSPRFVWSIAHDHEWMDLSVPGSRFGQDNTDNIYRLATIDPALSYRITGRFSQERPIDFSICSLGAQIGENIAADVVGFIHVDNIDVAPDGSFSITVDATLSASRRNHLCIARAKSLMVRDTMADWDTQRPCALSIARTDGPAVDDFDPARATARAAQLGKTIAHFFLTNIQHGMFETAPVNVIPDPVPSGPRGGLITQCATGGYYRLGDDEALVVTADRLGARYVGMQIVDMWMLSFEYRHHTSSLNHVQAVPNADGRYRWVISAADPGVYNWLDGSGNATGSILLRWQSLPPGAELIGSVSTEVVKLNALRSRLPADTRFVDTAGRVEQQSQRLRHYMARLTG